MSDVLTTVNALLDRLFKTQSEPNPKIETAPAPDGEGVMALVRDGYSMKEFDGQKELRREYTFHDLESFARWLRREARPAVTDILFGENEVVATTRPKERYGDRVQCSLGAHPRFDRWNRIFGKELTQELLHEHLLGALEDFPLDGKEVSQGELIAMQVAKFEVFTEGAFKCEVDERGHIRFQGSHDDVKVQGQLPGRFKIRIPVLLGVKLVHPTGKEAEPYLVEATYDVEVHLRLKVVRDRPPTFTLKCPSVQVTTRAAWLDGVAWLQHCLGLDWLVCLGTWKASEVPLVVKDAVLF